MASLPINLGFSILTWMEFMETLCFWLIGKAQINKKSD